MKFNSLLISLLVVAATVLCPATSFAEKIKVDQFNSLEASKGYFWGDDMTYNYSNYTVVQEYGSTDEDERLPMTELSKDDWMLLFYEYDSATKKKNVSKILIMPSESQAHEAKRMYFF